MSTDPLGFVDGLNLYLGYYVPNSADPSGNEVITVCCVIIVGGLLLFIPGCEPAGPKPRSEDECCKTAKADGLAGRAGGGVVCCDGRQVSCSWLTSSGNDIADRIAAKCKKKHEDTHHDDHKKCDAAIPSLYRGRIHDNVDLAKEECKAYGVEIQCLKDSKKDCKNDENCKSLIDGSINFLKRDGNRRFSCEFK